LNNSANKIKFSVYIVFFQENIECSSAKCAKCCSTKVSVDEMPHVSVTVRQ
jgi:hypothetical protein